MATGSRMHFSFIAAAILFMCIARFSAHPAADDYIDDLELEEERRAAPGPKGNLPVPDQSVIAPVPDQNGDAVTPTQRTKLDKIFDAVKGGLKVAGSLTDHIKKIALYVKGVKKDFETRGVEEDLVNEWMQ